MRVCVCNCGSRSPFSASSVSPFGRPTTPPIEDLYSFGSLLLPAPLTPFGNRKNDRSAATARPRTYSYWVQRSLSRRSNHRSNDVRSIRSARFVGARLRRRGISGRPTRNFREELRLVFYSSTKTSGSFVASLRSTRRQRANSSTSGLSRTL